MSVKAEALAYSASFACHTGSAFTVSKSLMYRNEDEKLSDKIMGEAVIELLDERESITSGLLLLKLHTFLLAAEETFRERAIRDAIRSVQAAVLNDGSRTLVQASLLH
jgi:probable RcsB/C two-component-system connector